MSTEKKQKFVGLSATELKTKLDELQKTLVKFRVSSDVSLLDEKSGIVGLRRDLRQLSRLLAQKK
jgi:ribosomal protein L29